MEKSAYNDKQSGLKGKRSGLRDPIRNKLKRKHKFYGDIVNGIMLAVGTPLMAYRMYIEGGVTNSDAALMVGFTGSAALFQVLAWKYDSLAFSRLGFLGNCAAGSHMELKEWPLKGVCTITPRFQAGIFVLCLANVSLSTYEQVFRMTAIFVVGSYVSIKSPYSVYTEDALPGLGGIVLVGFSVLYLFHNSASIRKNFNESRIKNIPTSLFNTQIQRDEFVVHVARLMLAGMYIHHVYRVCKEVFFSKATAEVVFDRFYELTKATIIATVGSVATGVFKTNIDQKEELEIMVQERTKEIRLKNIELRRINIAFEACETAIAITDAERTVVWTNQAFEALSKKTKKIQRRRSEECDSDAPEKEGPSSFRSDSSDTSSVVSCVDQQLTDAIMLEGHANQTKLRGAFDFSSPRHDEIEIQGDEKGDYSTNSQYRLEVTPFTDDLEEMLSSDDDDSLHEPALVIEASTCGGGRRGSGTSRRGSFTRRGSFQLNSHKLFLVAFHDITADRAREKAEQNAREESLLSKAMKDSMVTLTHELRTPLQGIMGITSLMLEQQDYERDSKQLTRASFVQDNAESLGLIMASSSLLLNLINNLLDVKKATANMMNEFLLEPLLASDPIRDAIDFCNPLASISNVNISMDCCGDAAESFVNANGLRLQQVLINMISNAIKYTDQGSTIRVSTRPSTVGKTMVALRNAIACCSDWEDPASFVPSDNSPVLVFSVSDSGPGIDRDQAQLLFHRFARLSQQPTRTLGNKTVGQPSGTGLGLHLCQMFIQRMRGGIWVENNPGRGSTFYFCLPLVGSPEEKLKSPSYVSPSKQLSPARKKDTLKMGHFPASFDYRKLRVLVVDDTLINRKVLDRMLKKIGVVEVSTAESGRDALDELFTSGNAYDLVITDLQMPGMSGTELTEEIMRRQEASEERDPPDELLTSPFRRPFVVVGLTADMSPGIAEKCAKSGMSDLLYKPITLVEIKEYFQTKISKLQPGEWRRNERRLSLH